MPNKIHTLADLRPCPGTTTVTVNDEKLRVEPWSVGKISQKLKDTELSEKSSKKLPTETSIDETSSEVSNKDETSSTISNKDETTSTISSKDEASALEKGVSLSGLKEDHLVKLSSRIDQNSSSGIPRWEYIIEKLIPEKVERDKKVANLRRAQHGGGNPALNFLKCLETMEDSPTKERFCKVSRESKRFDIPRLPFIKKVADSSILMSELELDEKLMLAGKLTKQGIENDWKHFADKFGFSKENKDRVSQTINEPNVYSPTKCLIEMLIEKGKTTSDLKSACKELCFQQTINFITEIEKEILSSS